MKKNTILSTLAVSAMFLFQIQCTMIQKNKETRQIELAFLKDDSLTQARFENLVLLDSSKFTLPVGYQKFQLFRFGKRLVRVFTTNSKKTTQMTIAESSIFDNWLMAIDSCLDLSPNNKSKWIAMNPILDLVNNNATGEMGQILLSTDLKDNAETVKKYTDCHRPENLWPEVLNAFNVSGYRSLRILVGSRYVVLTEDFPVNRSKHEMDSLFDNSSLRMKDWGVLMDNFQQAPPNAAGGNWVVLQSLITIKK